MLLCWKEAADGLYDERRRPWPCAGGARILTGVDPLNEKEGREPVLSVFVRQKMMPLFDHATKEKLAMVKIAAKERIDPSVPLLHDGQQNLVMVTGDHTARRSPRQRDLGANARCGHWISQWQGDSREGRIPVSPPTRRASSAPGTPPPTAAPPGPAWPATQPPAASPTSPARASPPAPTSSPTPPSPPVALPQLQPPLRRHPPVHLCIPSSRLRWLFLSSNRLSGAIPPSIFASRALAELALSENQLSGAIPATIGQLTALEKLDLHDNSLTGAIPEEIGILCKLTHLDLSENQISGGIPESIGELSKLMVLYLNQNHLTGGIPSSISGMASLQFCQMSENSLNGNLAASIGALPRIQRLILENNQLTGELPAAIGSLATLTDVFFSGDGFTGKIPSRFGNLARLQTLDLSRNHLSGPIPPELSKLRNLQALDPSFNPLFPQPGGPPSWLAGTNLFKLMLAGTGPSWLAGTNLFKLMLAGTGVTGPLPEWLSSASSISILDLSSNNLTGELPRWIGRMKGLSLLNISNNGAQAPPAGAGKGDAGPLGHYRTLDVSRNRFTGRLDEDIGELLAMNAVVRNRFTGGLDEDIGELARDAVEWLVVSENPGLGGRIPATMGRIRGTGSPEGDDGEDSRNRFTGGLDEDIGELARDAVEWLVVSENPRLGGRIPATMGRMEALKVVGLAGGGNTGGGDWTWRG
ncbi:putative Leucine-rich repeat [Cocos nucifera]|uniref:Putative Leucine-rich repeat n=1 Tax=Cocos nucifera TaxID=13894 RepID=A0A8K0N7E6_COCNU|nr:putative Leucine-rich repeat [Cocos nucifera]